MGFLRTITLYNDVWNEHTIRERPDEFVTELLRSMDVSSRTHEPDRLGHITTQPSRHADDHAIFIHYGNSVVEANHLVKAHPNVAGEYLRMAENQLDWAKKQLKKLSKP